MMRSGGGASRAGRPWALPFSPRRPRGRVPGAPAPAPPLASPFAPASPAWQLPGSPAPSWPSVPAGSPSPDPPDIDPAVAKDPEMSAAVEKTVLPDGLTVLSQTLRDRRTLSLGAWLRTGPRDEPREQLGITHFIEHMMFKGTTTRDARAIAASLESLGGHLDAFTSREQVCYTARVLSEHLSQAVDVVSDIVCRSRFDEAEIERERSVVREEILSYEDSPEAMVTDQLSAQLWGDHALGRPILGTVDTVATFTRAALVREFERRFRAGEIVVVAVGGSAARKIG